MRDIENRADLEVLLERFYKKLLVDPEIGYVFTEVAKIDLATHLVKIVDFWEQTLFSTGNYRNNVLKVHQDLNDLERLTPELFNTWLLHFNSTVDEMFLGAVSEKMKTRALSIATVMQIKLSTPE